MLAYVPSASVSDRPRKDGCCFQCLASTLTVMTMILQLRTGSCVKTFLHTTKGPTYARGNKKNCARKPIMPRLRYLRIVDTTNTSTYPQEDRKNRRLRGDILPPRATKNHPTSVKNKHRPSSASKNEREASKNEREATEMMCE